MTVVDAPSPLATSPEATSDPGSGSDGGTFASAGSDSAVEYDRIRLDARRVVLLAISFILILVVATGVVLYCVGPLMQARKQRTLLSAEQSAIAIAARSDEGLYRPTLPTQPPIPGATQGILAIPALRLQQAVVEGVAPSQTAAGPGHVPGTAGLGQPGNSAIVGRRLGYGGPFSLLGDLRSGDRILIATTEGQSVYVVHSIRQVLLASPATPTTAISVPAATGHAATVPTPTTASPRSFLGKHNTEQRMEATVDVNTLFGPSVHNQLTLVTSGNDTPWNSSQAIVVVARLHGDPFTATPQESRSLNQQGTTGDSDALAWLLLAALALVATLSLAVFLYRRSSLRSAYLLSTAPLLVFTILAAEAASRLLPAWV